MPSFVYACEECQTEIRHITTSLLNTSFADTCSKCKTVKKFKFIRDGNIGEDWYSKILIKNKRRRPGDALYREEEEERNEELDNDIKKTA